MIIQSHDGDDRQTIEDIEEKLCRRYRVTSAQLYPVLRQADFHRTYNDPPNHWNVAAYAAFAGEVLTHKLGYEELKALLADFDVERVKNQRAWAAVAAEDFLNRKGEAKARTYRDHVAIGLRYATCVADDYVFPVPHLLGMLTGEQFTQLNEYLDYVSSKCRIVAGRAARQSCQRHLDDLARSNAAKEVRQ